jgi:hypothetical protein
MQPGNLIQIYSIPSVLPDNTKNQSVLLRLVQRTCLDRRSFIAEYLGKHAMYYDDGITRRKLTRSHGSKVDYTVRSQIAQLALDTNLTMSTVDEDGGWKGCSDAGTDAFERWVDGMDEDDDFYYDSACHWGVLDDDSNYDKMADRCPSNTCRIRLRC